MKTNKFCAFLSAAAMLFGAGACNDDEVDNPSLSVSLETMNYNFDGSTDMENGKMLEIECNTSWAIVPEAGSEWIKCTPESGSGNATVKVAPMPSATARVGVINVVVSKTVYRSVTVNQAAMPVPTLTKLTPNALTWESEETDAKTIAVEYKDLNGAQISVACDNEHYTVTLEGSTVTVEPTAKNLSQEDDITATVTVSVKGGNSLTASLTHIKAEAPPVPVVQTLTPDALTWAADDLTAQTIAVSGEALEGATLVATVDKPELFNVAVSGLTVTVTPKAANTVKEPVTATLTVTAEGGTASQTATLTQKKYVPQGDWVRVETAPADFSGTYLIVYEFREGHITTGGVPTAGGHVVFDASLTADNIAALGNYLKATLADKKVTGLSTGKYDNPETADVNEAEAVDEPIAKEEWANHAVTITNEGGSYYMKSASGKYLFSNKHAAMSAVDESTPLLSISLEENCEVTIIGGQTNKGVQMYMRFNDKTQVCKFFKSKDNDWAPIYLYKFVEK